MVPGLVGCLKWWWLPLTLTNVHPSASSSLISTLLFTSCPFVVEHGVTITLQCEPVKIYNPNNPACCSESQWFVYRYRLSIRMLQVYPCSVKLCATSLTSQAVASIWGLKPASVSGVSGSRSGPMRRASIAVMLNGSRVAACTVRRSVSGRRSSTRLRTASSNALLGWPSASRKRMVSTTSTDSGLATERGVSDTE